MVKSLLVLFWFTICFVLYLVMLHNLALQQYLPGMKSAIQQVHDVLLPYFFRKNIF